MRLEERPDPVRPASDPVRPASDPVRPASDPVWPASDPVRPASDPVAEVVVRMERLTASLPARDGVRAFNQMYLTTTRHVAGAIRGARFTDPAFMTRLDVVFAGLFLDTWERYAASPRGVPKCWRALFEARNRADVAPLQFAIAGMNAHINHDLAQALVRTCLEVGGELDATRRADFLAINRVLADTQPAVRAELLRGPLALVDHALGDQDDRVAVWGIEQAREFAWSTARTLWEVRDTPLEGPFAAGLDRMVALSSRLLLFGPGSRAALPDDGEFSPSEDPPRGP